MRSIGGAAFVFFCLVGTAHAGTITATGGVVALTNVNQLKGIYGTGNFDEGPTTGTVPATVYSSQGLTWRSGDFATILPGCTVPGTGALPNYATFPSFPTPIGGGGTHVGQSNMFAGVATFSVPITQVGLTASTNGTQYLTAFAANGSMIGQVTWIPAADSAFVGIDTLGVPIAMITYGNDDLWGGQTYNISGATIISDTWIWATACTSNATCDDSNPCTNDVCNVSGICSHPPTSGAACNDNNPCTQNDVCQVGVCNGTPVACAPLDQCHLAGTCNPANGQCSNPVKPDGTSCADGNSCTQTDTCTAGVCTGNNPVVCAAPSQCQQNGTCDATTGQCTYANKADGTACNDANACTQTDACLAGVCTGGNPVACAASDQCHTAGVCDTTTGTCTNPAKADGATCDDGNLCTQADTCQVGACTGGNPVTCPAIDDCHDAGTCDATTGQCSNVTKADGTACNDGNACTTSDTCLSGVCTGASPVGCTASDSCHDVGSCDVTTGTCSDPAKPDGTTCPGGTCTAGACVPSGTGGSAGAGTGGAAGAATGGSGGSGATGGSGGTTSGGTGGTGATGGSGKGGSGATGGSAAAGGSAAKGGGSGSGSDQSSGCGCRAVGSSQSGAPSLALLLLFALGCRSRTRRSRRDAK